MKPHPNKKRRAGRAFNGIDVATGYAVRFEMNRQGRWCSSVISFPAYSYAPSLRTVRRHTHEAIGYCLEDAAEEGWEVPEPEGKPAPFDLY
jgi:hypothetical protein